ncbi:hypothetical protein Y032_0005g2472 [Ancylostoma ceylanicum]|uniref:Uncharacterized protein n=1 Tax=Ancylostoma ceylanicum TaxID=53326 RepID=A0A016VRW1_9BILA|nr:hypothetical protein Y032_0005g2472 [Ancylostoma ceylanicum]
MVRVENGLNSTSEFLATPTSKPIHQSKQPHSNRFHSVRNHLRPNYRCLSVRFCAPHDGRNWRRRGAEGSATGSGEEDKAVDEQGVEGSTVESKVTVEAKTTLHSRSTHDLAGCVRYSTSGVETLAVVLGPCSRAARLRRRLRRREMRDRPRVKTLPLLII